MSGLRGLLPGSWADRSRRNGRAPRRSGEASGEADPLAVTSRTRRAAADLADAMLRATGADTAHHSRGVERIALRMADRLGLNGYDREMVGVAARLHDIGKVAIPPGLLEKPTRPTPNEWELIRDHTVIGERILRSVAELRPAASLVRHSHEHWDGGGYPDGLRGEQIPLASRIIFCADTFDAISTDRPYHSRCSPAAALAEIRRCAGTQFEPRVVDALAQVIRKELYGGAWRTRRRAHSHLSVLLVFALSLAGSVTGGLAASEPPPLRENPSSAAPKPEPPAPTPGAGGLALVPDPIASGSVAGALARSEPAEVPRRSQPGRDPRPAAPPAATTPTGTGGAGGGAPVTDTAPVEEAAPGIRSAGPSSTSESGSAGPGGSGRASSGAHSSGSRQSHGTKHGSGRGRSNGSASGGSGQGRSQGPTYREPPPSYNGQSGHVPPGHGGVPPGQAKKGG